MGKKRKSDRSVAAKPAERDQPTTLKDLLNPEIVKLLNRQADDLKAAEEQRKEEARKKAEEVVKAEQKRLENDFGHLLNNSSMNWKTFK
jgi:hypothetical protein